MAPAKKTRTEKPVVKPQKSKAPSQPEKEAPWELRMIECRKLGEQLRQSGGTGPAAVRSLLTTLTDSRCLSEVSLQRTATEALTPAAEIGHRGALAAQAARLTSNNDTVRNCALQSLLRAAEGHRPQPGGAVAAALAEALPPKNASYSVESRQRGADALIHLAPIDDPHLLKTAARWLEDEDPRVQLSATTAMGFIGRDKDSIESVALRLTDKNWRVSRAAVASLEQMVPRAERPVSNRPSAGRKSVIAQNCQPFGLSGQEFASRDEGRNNSRESNREESKGVHVSKPRGNIAVVVKALTKACSGEPGGEKRCPLLGLVRGDAVQALGNTGIGDGNAMQAVGSRLCDGDDDVRQRAAKSLAKLAQGERATAMRLAGQALGDIDFRVRASAGQAYSEVSLQGNVNATIVQESAAAAAALLEKPDWRSRRGVGRVLRELSLNAQSRMEGDVIQITIDAVAPQLSHEDWSVRRKAVQAIASIAEGNQGSRYAIEVLAPLADDPDTEVLLALSRALPLAAPRRCKRAVQIAATLAGALVEGCEGPDGSVHDVSKTITTQPSVTNVGSTSLVTRDTSELVAFQKHPVEVRLSALDAVEALASEGRCRSRTAIAAIATLIEDPDQEVSSAAERVFCTIGRGRRCAVDYVCGLLLRSDQAIREAGVRCFRVANLAMKKRALARTMPLIKHHDPAVRNSASRASAVFTAGTEQEGIAVQAAANIMARFRKNRLPEPQPMSPDSSCADSDGGKSNISKGSKFSKFSKTSTKLSANNKHKQRTALSLKASSTGLASPTSGSSRQESKEDGSSRAGSKPFGGRNKTRTTSKASSQTNLSKLTGLVRGDASKTSGAKSEQERLEKEEAERLAYIAELDRLENGPQEEDFSDSETDDELNSAVESSEDESDPVQAVRSSTRGSMIDLHRSGSV